MPHARIVVIGASAGGLKAVRAVLAGLPAVFPAGALSDGTLGLQAIKHAGGLAVVQHPITCPSCGGTISEVEEEGLADDECYVGHRFDAESLVALTDGRTDSAPAARLEEASDNRQAGNRRQGRRRGARRALEGRSRRRASRRGCRRRCTRPPAARVGRARARSHGRTGSCGG